MALEKMTLVERQAVFSLAAIMSLRLFGLFMILPVFALYARGLPGSTPFLIGIAMGIYGLTQAIFQIPFGMLSDHVGRKPMITIGLILFALGSVIAACSHTIYIMIIGRALQGAGAVGSTIIAMMADLTRNEQRTKAMAINGMTIGLSFSLAMIAGPMLAAWVQISGIFWIATLLSFIAITILYTITPKPSQSHWHADTEPETSQFVTILKDPQLARLNTSVFILHAIFTASFVVIPISLQQFAGIPGHQQWLLYVPTLIIAFFISIMLIIRAEKKRQLKSYFLLGIITLGIGELGLSLWTSHILAAATSLLCFFTAFSLLEAFLPSWISRSAPQSRKGTALGVYSCAQFLGIFVGGSIGGWLYGVDGLKSVYLFCVLFAVTWLAVVWNIKSPQYVTSRHPSS